MMWSEVTRVTFFVVCVSRQMLKWDEDKAPTVSKHFQMSLTMLEAWQTFQRTHAQGKSEVDLALSSGAALSELKQVK